MIGTAGYAGASDEGGLMPDQLVVRCPSCDHDIQAADEDGLVNDLQQHLRDEHDLEMPVERVRENVAAQLRDFDGYNARPISGA
jgi:predicted small metal-binding protein